MTRLTREIRRIVVGHDVLRIGDRVQLTVRFASEGVYARLTGSRTEYGPLPWCSVLLQCARVSANELRKARKNGKRVSRGLLAVGR